MKMMVVMFICIFIKFTEAEVGEISRKSKQHTTQYRYKLFSKTRCKMSIIIFIKFCYVFLECLEYSKYVYVQEDSPILSMRRSSSSTSKVSKCGIVETKLIVGGERVDNELEFPHMVNYLFTGSHFSITKDKVRQHSSLKLH
jgi:hypothetical protein